MSQDVALKLERHGLKLIKKLGEGGMATVYLAEDVNLGRKLAAKVILPHLAQNADFVSRFLREVKTLARLDHPAIPAIYQFSSDGDFLFYTMRYIEGETLTDLLTRKNKLSIEEFTRIAVPIADALDYAHKQGIVHRDIKPDNIIVGEQIFLMDFGIAKILENEAATRTGSFIGTLNYASPEQLEGGTVGVESDIYSLGVLAYQALSGQLPFTGGQSAIISGHLTKEPPALTALPQSSVEAVKKALSKKSSDRYKLARDFTTALNSSSAGLFSVPSANSASEHTRILSAEELHQIQSPAAANPKKRSWLSPVLLFSFVGMLLGVNAYLDYYLGENYLDCQGVTVYGSQNTNALCDNNLGTLWQHRIDKNLGTIRLRDVYDNNIFYFSSSGNANADGLRIFYPQNEMRNNKGAKIKKLVGVYGNSHTLFANQQNSKMLFTIYADSDEDKYLSIPIPADKRGHGVSFVIEELFNPQHDLILSDIRPYEKNYPIEISRTIQTITIYLIIIATVLMLPLLVGQRPNKVFAFWGLSDTAKAASYSFVSILALMSIVSYYWFFISLYDSHTNGTEAVLFLSFLFVWVPSFFGIVPLVQNSKFLFTLLIDAPIMIIFTLSVYFSTNLTRSSENERPFIVFPIVYALFAKVLATICVQKLTQGKWRIIFKVFFISHWLILITSAGFIALILIAKHIDFNYHLEAIVTIFIFLSSFIFWNTLSIKYFIRRLRS